MDNLKLKQKYYLQLIYYSILFFLALVLNLLKDIFERVLLFLIFSVKIFNSVLKKNKERSKISFNKFRTSAESLNAVFTAEPCQSIRTSVKENKHFFSLFCLRMAFFLFSVFPYNLLSVDQLSPEHHNEQIEQIIHDGYKLIDKLFENARASVEAHQDLMDEQWLSNQKEIKELRNILSDSQIAAFDTNIKNGVPNKLSLYVKQKINKELEHIFGISDISTEQVKDFYRFAYTMCTLSDGSHCDRMMRDIKNDNFENMLQLKIKKEICKQLKKETSQQLCDALIFGKR